VNIVDTLTGAECWHYEFREDRWERYKKQHGYAAMARAMKKEIGNLVGIRQVGAREREVEWLQAALNKTLGTRLAVNGMYNEKTKEAVRKFQRKYGLQVDGVAGPITKGKLKAVLGEA
jgi:peptidoglycan hydrolase-like protein with peptidoglycan-binding domain